MKLLIIALFTVGVTFIFSQQPIIDVISKVPNAVEIKITNSRFFFMSDFINVLNFGKFDFIIKYNY